jgi:aryl-alcohol dehydrogenase
MTAMEIQAAVFRGTDESYRVETVELDEPGPGEVLVRIAGVGMCHTDTLMRFGAGTLPMIGGHEGSGVVSAVGPGVTEVAVGDHVVLSFDSCGDCENCRRAHPAFCETFIGRNFTGSNLDGSTSVRDASGEAVRAWWFQQSSFGTHALATVRNVVKVDPDVPLELLGPLGCGVLTGAGSVFNSLKVEPGTSFAVFGAGAVGLSAVMAARVAGASTIIAVDLHQSRLELARELGATHVVDGNAADVGDQVRAAAGGEVQYALDTTGVPAVLSTAIGTLRQIGTPRAGRHADGRSRHRAVGPRGRSHPDRHRRGRRRTAAPDSATDRTLAAGPVPVRPAGRDLPTQSDQRGGKGVTQRRRRQARPAAGLTAGCPACRSNVRLRRVVNAPGHCPEHPG